MDKIKNNAKRRKLQKENKPKQVPRAVLEYYAKSFKEKFENYDMKKLNEAEENHEYAVILYNHLTDIAKEAEETRIRNEEYLKNKTPGMADDELHFFKALRRWFDRGPVDILYNRSTASLFIEGQRVYRALADMILKSRGPKGVKKNG